MNERNTECDDVTERYGLRIIGLCLTFRVIWGSNGATKVQCTQ